MKFFKQTAILFGLLLAALFISNKASAGDASNHLHIRTIASSCYACHGTHGNPAEGNFSIKHKTLAGMPASKFEQKMLAFRTGEAESTVMHHHAENLTPEEIKGLANYFSQQKVLPSTLPPHKKLEAAHD